MFRPSVYCGLRKLGSLGECNTCLPRNEEDDVVGLWAVVHKDNTFSVAQARAGQPALS